jgi:Ca-activated chloride channel homolog
MDWIMMDSGATLKKFINWLRKNILKLTLVIGSIFFLCCTAAAQPQFYFRGEVKDETGKPIPNVLIRQGSTGYVFYTGSTGTFGIEAYNKVDTLFFSADGYEKKSQVADAAAYTKVSLVKSVVKPKISTLSSRTPNFNFRLQQSWLTGEESYADIIENGFIAASQYPSTALTLNIDRASYSNIRRFINEKEPVPPDAARIEEMLNYFNLDYSEPSNRKDFDIVTTLTGCPWNPSNQVLFARINSRKVGLENLPPTHLVFLVDASASMDANNRLPLLKSAFRGLVENLREQDSVSIVVYGSTVGIRLDATSGSEKKKIIAAMNAIEPGGFSPGESGIKMAYGLARRHFIKQGNNRVILATDGDFNVGVRSDEELEQMIREQGKSGIYLTCLGMGMGNYKDSKVQTLAEQGNGNFAYIDSYAEGQKVLLKEFMQTIYAIADDARLEIAFNPEYVEQYRVIGFDNRYLAAKDSGAIIAGGEIGSGFSMLVAFEIQPRSKITQLPSNLGDLRVVYKRPGKTEVNEMKITAPLQVVVFNSLPKFYRFATSVIMFGSLLRESKFIKDKGWGDALAIAQQSYDPQDVSQKEFVSLLEKGKTIYTGKKKKHKTKED